MNVPALGREVGAVRWGNHRVVVVGAGRSGRAAAHLLLDCGAEVTMSDARPLADLTEIGELIDRGVEIVAGDHPADIWKDAVAAVFSPGVRPDSQVAKDAREAGVDVIGEIDLAADLVQTPVIAVTGSNGKSTVTSMVGAILAAAGLEAPVCGNIGTAFCEAARAEIVAGARRDAYVVEISSFQGHYLRGFHPRFAAILNLQPDHLDWHGSFDAYADAKLRVAGNMKSLDWLVYNGDDVELVKRIAGLGANLMPFADEPEEIDPPLAWVAEGELRVWPRGGEPTSIMATEDLHVIGPHNAANACAAAALATLFGISPPFIAEGLAGYRALEHRMESCGEVDGIACINDSKATNVDATLAALSGFDRGVWLILGGRDKGADFGELLPVLDDRIARVLLIGEATEAIATAIGGAAPSERCGTLPRAVARALDAGAPGDTLLLSPACTSFDQYPNFEERGRHFKALVATRLADRKTSANSAREL